MHEQRSIDVKNNCESVSVLVFSRCTVIIVQRLSIVCEKSSRDAVSQQEPGRSEKPRVFLEERGVN